MKAQEDKKELIIKLSDKLGLETLFLIGSIYKIEHLIDFYEIILSAFSSSMFAILLTTSKLHDDEEIFNLVMKLKEDFENLLSSNNILNKENSKKFNSNIFH